MLDLVLKTCRLNNLILHFSDLQNFLSLDSDLGSQAFQVSVQFQHIFVVNFEIIKGNFEEEKDTDGVPNRWIA